MSKRFSLSFISTSAFLSCLLLAGTGLRLGAQGDNGRPAGGAWNVYNSEDKMTAARRVRFEIYGNSDQKEPRGGDARGQSDDYPAPRGQNDSRGPRSSRDARDYPPPQPRIEIYCENGNFKRADFVPGMRIAPPNRPGFWGQPQMQVRVRANDSPSSHGWNWAPDFLAMDKNTTRELIGAQLFRVEFLGDRGPVIAEFSPAGLEQGSFTRACGLKPKKP